MNLIDYYKEVNEEKEGGGGHLNVRENSPTHIEVRYRNDPQNLGKSIHS